MLVVGYYHYPCQGVISFVLGWATIWRKVNLTGVENLGLWRKTLFFHDVEKGMDPRLRGDDRGVAGGFFCCGGSSVCFLGGRSRQINANSWHD